MTFLYIDLETRAITDLKKLGVYKYTEDPTFRILMAGWAHDDEPIKMAVGHDEIREIPGLWHVGTMKVAHNAPFERLALSTLQAGYITPECWLDTASLAAEYGYPTSLEAAARALGAAPKDSAGSALVKLFTRPNKDGSWNDETTHPLEWLDFLAYCEQDVDTLRDIHKRLGDWPNDMEHRVWCADQRVNDRGMKVDRVLCQVAAEAAEDNQQINGEKFRELTGVDNPASVPQVMRWVADCALDLPNLQADTVKRALADPNLDPEHREALELRQELAGSASAKFGAALEVVSGDSRIRGGFRFFGAHTGRWTGQRVQPQNLPRASLDNEDAVDAAILDLKLGLGAEPDTLKALVRSMFTGPLTVVDYAAIEARVVAWLAGEEWALQAFRDGRDIYVETAERMGNGMTRKEGKVAVLALGYNGGVNSLRALGYGGKAGDEDYLDDDTLWALVRVWRNTNKKITQLWELMGNAVDEGGQVGPRLRIIRRGSKMEMKLPSGRSIWYHGVAWEKYRVKDPVTGKSVVKEGWRYNDPKKGGQRIGTYGGRLVENATQAVARDILAEALVRLHDKFLPVVGHVHDEVIVEGEKLELVKELLTVPPKWAKGLPIDAEGFTCQRYRKG